MSDKPRLWKINGDKIRSATDDPLRWPLVGIVIAPGYADEIVRQHNEQITALRGLLATARADAIEECAKVVGSWRCVDHGGKMASPDDPPDCGEGLACDVASEIAAALRALKGTEPTTMETLLDYVRAEAQVCGCTERIEARIAAAPARGGEKRPMKRYWMSWYQPTPDHRPLTYPPNGQIRGWWCSGERADGAFTLCAVVDAPGEEEAKAGVRFDWPEADDWRFIDERDASWSPGDRFPAVDWMVPRLATLVTVAELELRTEGKA